jgi:uncharacterized protein
MSNNQWQPRTQEPAWVEGRTAESGIRERDFIRGVYTWMFTGLALTAATALLVLRSAAMQQIVFGNPMVTWGLLIFEFILVMYLQVRITRMSAAAAAGAFLFYSALNGLTLSVIFLVYTASSIAQAFITASAMFAGMSIYGYVTKRDLTSWGTYLVMATWGIFIALLVNGFLLKSSALSMGISIIGVLVFTGLTAYDTQRLKAFASAPELRENLAVYGALMLYLDFINLFLMLLRLFGGRRD